MKKEFIIAMVFVAILAVSAIGGETTVKGKIFGHWMMDMTDGADSFNEFGMGRSYLTAISKLSERTSARITTDLRKVNGYDGYTIILKYAYFDWTPAFAQDKMVARFGLQPTKYVAVANKAWGRRYIVKSICDKVGYKASSDLGASLTFNMGQEKTIAKVGLAILNGTSFYDVSDLNKQKDYNFYATVLPFSNNDDLKSSYLFGQFYMGTRNRVMGATDDADDYKNQIISMGAIVAYRSMLDVGFDFNFRTFGNGPDVEDKSTAFSFFGTLYLAELAKNSPSLRTLNLFGRIDIFDPNTDTDNDGESYIIFGLECNPIKGFKASLNYQTEGFEDDTENSENYLYLNTEVNF
ncbi:MAG: hypothetical protein U9N54_06560 [candidate division Zixibacteria bacterium]|nr:hypothetical protein [candidate division Zixibacteria bacterium]